MRNTLAILFVVSVTGLLYSWVSAADRNVSTPARPATATTTAAATQPTPQHWVLPSPMNRPATRRADLGPDTVLMKELVDQYEPVPFDHKSHALMAEMWDGCVTCHHRSPNGKNGQAAPVPPGQPALLKHPSQETSQDIPACKSCHPPTADETSLTLPNLKGAYHRQCLNCHREWMHDNACEVCHARRDTGGSPATRLAEPRKTPLTPDDIVGRMHPPLPEPDVLTYVTRYTPAVGPMVVFRHKEHTADYGLRCVSCHRRDSCSSCHDAKADLLPHARSITPISLRDRTLHSSILKPGRTWEESHSPCIACHTSDRCNTCHYKEGESAPPPFDHEQTGQSLDADHSALTCFQCHTTLRSRSEITCGDATCHSPDLKITYPLHLPGPRIAPRAANESPKGPMKGIVR